MPIYEYKCRTCGKRSTVFARSISAQIEAVCFYCNSKEMERAISSFAYHRSEQSRREDSRGSSPFGDSMDYFKDPESIGRHVEETFEKYGIDVPDSVKETITSAREGEMPKGLDL